MIRESSPQGLLMYMTEEWSGSRCTMLDPYDWEYQIWNTHGAYIYMGRAASDREGGSRHAIHLQTAMDQDAVCVYIGDGLLKFQREVWRYACGYATEPLV